MIFYKIFQINKKINYPHMHSSNQNFTSLISKIKPAHYWTQNFTPFKCKFRLKFDHIMRHKSMEEQTIEKKLTAEFIFNREQGLYKSKFHQLCTVFSYDRYRKGKSKLTIQCISFFHMIKLRKGHYYWLQLHFSTSFVLKYWMMIRIHL